MTTGWKANQEPAELSVTALNQGLMLGIVRQHELTEAAELLNVELQLQIVARKKAEAALVDSQKLASAGRMAAVLAHEINNPLQAITNALYQAQTAEGVPDSVREILFAADGELKRIAHITRQTLGFYKEASAPSTFTMISMLDSVVDLLVSRRSSRHAIIDTQCDSQLLLTALPGEIRQVLSNLLMNSLDAITDGGHVTLRAAPSTDFRGGRRAIRITVADDGIGMSGETLSQLFTPFFTTKGDTGNGLGLWVSKQLVERHGGSIQVRSRTQMPSQGSSISILLPVLDSGKSVHT